MKLIQDRRGEAPPAPERRLVLRALAFFLACLAVSATLFAIGFYH